MTKNDKISLHDLKYERKCKEVISINVQLINSTQYPKVETDKAQPQLLHTFLKKRTSKFIHTNEH